MYGLRALTKNVYTDTLVVSQNDNFVDIAKYIMTERSFG